MKANTIIGPDTTMSTFREYIRAHVHCDHYSDQFSKNVHATSAYRTGDYGSQQDHLTGVADAQDDDRLASDLYHREMNPAQLIRIIEDAGAPAGTVKKAYDAGRAAWNDALSQGLPASAACGKSCAVIRRHVTWTYLHCASANDVVPHGPRPEASF